MKIYILHIDKMFRPKEAPFKYPRHSDWVGVELIFYNWINTHQGLLTDDPNEADFHYLPIFWTNYHLNHNYGKTGREQLQRQCDQTIQVPEKTFTLCQYDDGPMVDLQGAFVFLSSRTTADDLDIPLLCSPHKFKKTKKKYVANFVGRTRTHPIRKELYELIRKDKKYKYVNRILGTEHTFVNIMLKSYACLCPRGYGGSSFRFFEAMQMGVVPVHIGDQDIRPFKDFLPWDQCSFYFENPKDAVGCLDHISMEQLSRMGNRAKKVYDRFFAGDKWCELCIKELCTKLNVDYDIEFKGAREMDEEKQMNLLFCANEAYMPKLAATLCSFWESNTKNFNEVHIYIRITDVTDLSQRELMRLAIQYGFDTRRISFVSAVDVNHKLEGLGVAKFKGNYLTYHKIFGLDLIDAKGRLLVLDADLYIRKDIRQLYNLDMGECPIGAVMEYPTPLNIHGEKESQEYNGGVWLVDLEKYKEKDVQGKMVDYIHSMPNDWATGDQTLVSFALGKIGMVYRVPLRYNFLLNYLAYKPDDFYSIHQIKNGFYSKDEFREAQKNPAIIHMILGMFIIPPWFAQGTEPIKSKWKSYLADTMWSETYLEKLDSKWLLQVRTLKMFKAFLPHRLYVWIMRKIVEYTRGRRI